MLEEVVDISSIFINFSAAMADLTQNSTMSQLNADFPGARRALFAKYHVGGCSSCAYDDNETISSVADRNEFDVNEAIQYILESHQHDQEMMLTPREAEEKIKGGAKLIDTRTREEHEAVAIKGSLFLTQEFQQEAFGTWEKETIVILYDHSGDKALDTCAWFRGHNLPNTFIIQGGIDNWSIEIDSSLPRYRLELE